MKGLCKECDKRDSCTELCVEAEEYVNQEVLPSSREFLIGNVDNFSEPAELGTTKPEFWIVYELYFLDKKPIDEILYHVSYTRRNIYRIIKTLKDNVMEETSLPKRRILKSLFLDEEPFEAILDRFGDFVYEVINAYVLEVKTRTYHKKV